MNTTESGQDPSRPSPLNARLPENAAEQVLRLTAELASATKRAEELNEALFENRPCVGVHGNPPPPTVGLVFDEQWGWMALCGQHIAGVDLNKFRVIWRSPLP